MTNLQDFIEKLNTVPLDANRYLRHIRELDKKVQQLQPKLIVQQNAFVEKVKQTKQKKLDPKTLQQEYAQIVKFQKFIYGMIAQKVKVSEQLFELVNQPTQKLENQVAKIRGDLKKSTNNSADDDFGAEKQLSKKKKYRAELKINTQRLEKKQETKEWLYDRNEPKYCRCGGVSFGQMVQCEHPYCEREWFHRECIPDKNLPDQWYCEDCRKLRQKIKTANPKWYF